MKVQIIQGTTFDLNMVGISNGCLISVLLSESPSYSRYDSTEFNSDSNFFVELERRFNLPVLMQTIANEISYPVNFIHYFYFGIFVYLKVFG